MGELINCPLCGGTHPKGTTFCDVMWADIPREPDEEEASSELESGFSATATEDQRRGRCSVCGFFGTPGEECWQCGSIVEDCAKESRVLLRIGDGPSVYIEPDKTIVIGRESDSRAIADALAGFDIVSRRHCSIHLSQDATFVTVIDNGSTNGTYIGKEAERLDEGIACTMKLPAHLRLGSCVDVLLEPED